MRRLLAPVAVLAALVAGCGVPEDDSPEELSADEVPFDLLTVPTTTTEPGPGTDPERQARLYFVNADGRLVEVEAEVADQSPQAIVTALLDADPETLDPGVSSFVPPGTTLLTPPSIDDDRVMTVDLSEEFLSVTSDRLTLAVAQIVFTAAAVPGGIVSSVAFEVDGDRIDVTDEDGAAQSDPVSPNDYQGLLAVSG